MCIVSTIRRSVVVAGFNDTLISENDFFFIVNRLFALMKDCMRVVVVLPASKMHFCDQLYKMGFSLPEVIEIGEKQLGMSMYNDIPPFVRCKRRKSC